MKLRVGFLSSALLLLSAAVAQAQALPYSETFDGGAGLPAGWTETHTSADVPPPRWDVDATPGTVGDGAGGTGVDGPTFGGSTGSLNYNDGTDYEEDAIDGPNSGAVTSPAISVGGSSRIIVSFQCNYETEDTGSTWDVRRMDVLDGVSLAVISSFTYNSAAPLNCAAMGTFHPHSHGVTLPALTTSVRIRFNFSSVDALSNAFSGWFIDNLSICGDGVVPTTPTLVFPVGGGIVLAPVSLDWSDSTDSTDCGVGVVLGYEVEVDTTNPPLAPFVFSATPATSTVSSGALAPGTYFWRVRAVDEAGNLGAYSTVESFEVEAPTAPGAADTLFVNEQNDGAQSGDGGFANPVTDEQPVFSAIYRDPNAVDSAGQLQFQVTDDPTFTIVLYDSGVVTLGAPLPKDERCPDQQILISLQRDTVHYWRIRYTDLGGLTGPYSAAQSFRIGDDFEFGVRRGSSHRSRHGCWVATAAWGGRTSDVAGLMEFRGRVLESSGAGSWFSRVYATAGQAPAAVVAGSPARGAVRLALTPLAAAAGTPGVTAALAGLIALILAVAAVRRF
ncbi:MAG: hypothetical protein HUU15_11745 [Candidatus Brocadiae bacterium]|nr:hypothetical protein [Candidatus Brocadiia bacterium]